MNKETEMKWEERNCMRCALRLGCPHSKFAMVDINPPNKEWFIKNKCIPNCLSKEREQE